MKSKTCILPWIHMATTTTGRVKPCCIYKTPLEDDDGRVFNLATDDASDIWNCSEMQELRRAHLNGETPKGCEECWQHEEIGKKSKRLTDNERFKHLSDRIVDKVAVTNPVYLDLKLGNLCNLSCRICFSGSSSTWVPEEIFWMQRDNNGMKKKDTIAYKNSKMGQWPEENPLFWNHMEKIMGGIEFLDFTGGEPFMIKKHWDFLQTCIDHGVAKNISIHYNTNGTQMPEDPSIWSHFKHVEVMVSIDGIGKRFEYQRHPAKWDEVYANIKKFQAMDYVHASLCHTVSALNIYYLPEFIDWFKWEGFPDHALWLNTLHGAPHYNVKSLPDHLKVSIRKRLKRYTGFEIPALLDFMDSESWKDEHWVSFLFNTGRGDSYRGEDFTEVFKEFHDEF